MRKNLGTTHLAADGFYETLSTLDGGSSAEFGACNSDLEFVSAQRLLQFFDDRLGSFRDGLGVSGLDQNTGQNGVRIGQVDRGDGCR